MIDFNFIRIFKIVIDFRRLLCAQFKPIVMFHNLYLEN